MNLEANDEKGGQEEGSGTDESSPAESGNVEETEDSQDVGNQTDSGTDESSPAETENAE